MITSLDFSRLAKFDNLFANSFAHFLAASGKCVAFNGLLSPDSFTSLGNGIRLLTFEPSYRFSSTYHAKYSLSDAELLPLTNNYKLIFTSRDPELCIKVQQSLIKMIQMKNGQASNSVPN